MTDAFRLPLQTGASALHCWARGIGSLVAAILVGAGGAVVLFYAGKALVPHVFIFGGALVMWLGGYGIHRLRKAVRARASDVVVTADGLRLQGGRHAAAYRGGKSWAQIATEQWRVEERKDEEERWGSTCLVARAEHASIVLAEAETAEEAGSLMQLAETVARAAQRGLSHGPSPTVPASPTILRCDGCGGPVPGDDRPAQRCEFCGRDVAVPGDMRARIRAARRVRASANVTPRLVERVLEQPGANRTNATLVAGGASMLLLWPGAVWAGVELGQAGRLGALAVLGLVLVPVCLFWTLYALLSWFLARRRAVALVALRLGATPGARAGRDYSCRNCAAALTASDQRVVVACEYCRSPNVLGLDLRAEAAAAASQEESLERDLSRLDRHRARTRRALWWALAASAAGAALLGSALLG